MAEPQLTEKSSDNRRQIGERITAFYELKGLKRPAFAKLLGIPYDRQLSYEQGRAEPPSSYWKIIQEIYPDADIAFLVTGTEGVLQPAESEERRIPILNEVPAGQMNFNYADEDIQGWLFTTNKKDAELFALQVKGDSMTPEINNGDVVICAPGRSFVNGQIYVVVTTESEATVKKVYRKQGGYTLQPMNPDFEPLFLSEEKILRLIRVLESRRRYSQ